MIAERSVRTASCETPHLVRFRVSAQRTLVNDILYRSFATDAAKVRSSTPAPLMSLRPRIPPRIEENICDNDVDVDRYEHLLQEGIDFTRH